MPKILFFAFLFAAFTSFGSQIDCRELPSLLTIKSLESTPESAQKFAMNFKGYEWSMCFNDYSKYTVSNSRDIATATFESNAITFQKGKDWLEFQKTSDGIFSLYINGMNDPVDQRIWHTWYVIFSEGSRGVLVHEATVPDFARRPGEAREVLKEEIGVIVRR